MSTGAQPMAGLDHNLTALEVLAQAQQQLDTDNLWAQVLAESSPLDALDDVVVMLCRHARVPATLATAADSVGAALVAQRYHLAR